MVVIVFRSRIRPESADAYYALAGKMLELARAMPGFISHKAFHADDGERVSVHEWETPAHLKACREHPDHLKAQAAGRQDFYEEYVSYVCDEPRIAKFQRLADLGRASSN